MDSYISGSGTFSQKVFKIVIWYLEIPHVTKIQVF